MLDELEKLAKAATPGPWEHFVDRGSYRDCHEVIVPEWIEDEESPEGGWPGVGETVCGDIAAEDAAFIAAANPDTVLKLIAVARAAKLVQQSDFPLIQIDATCDNLRAMGEALKALEEF